MKGIYLILVIGIFSVAVGGFAWKNLQTLVPPERGSGRIELETSFLDLGDIDQGGGIVSRKVTVRNAGSTPLRIYRLSTSCGCTTANMDTAPLKPNEQRTLTIRFDPMTHPDESGPITRAVYLQTSDSERPETEISIAGNVIPIQ